MSGSILSMENVTMQFGGVVAVNNLNLDVEEGKITALIGPNGAGKTTAFNCITGVYEPTNGMVVFDGTPIIRNHPSGKMAKAYCGENRDLYTSSASLGDAEDKETARAARKARDPYAFSNKVLHPTPDRITHLGIARTFQNIRLFGARTVLENVLIAKHMRAKQNVLSATFRGNWKEERRMREEAMALLEEQNLAHLKDEVASSLPYGLQRRLEIARALATSPKLLLLDEPAAGMNPQETNELTEFIHQIRKAYHLSILMIEHHMDLVMGISDKIYVLDFGKLIAEGTPDVIRNDQRVIDAYLGVVEDAED